jgi:dolichol-phosphate mannosyltransferase
MINELGLKNSNAVLIIPVLNEGERIMNQLSEIIQIKKRNFDVVIVDGGSTDGSISSMLTSYSNLLRTVLVVPDSKGLSHQLRVAFEYCLRENYEYFVTMDGNNKDDVNGIELIIKKLEDGFEYIQGNRFLSTHGSRSTPLHRTLAIKLIHDPVVSVAARKKFTDTTNGFRGFSRSLLENRKVNIFRNIFVKYELITYIPIRVGQLKLKSCDVPVIRSYPLNSKIPTKISGFKNHFNLINTLFLSAIGYYNPKDTK